MFVHWIYGLERVLSIRHYGETCYLRVTRDRREPGAPLDLQLAGPEAFSVHRDPSMGTLFHVYHDGEMLTLKVGYHAGRGRNLARPEAVMVSMESGPMWSFAKVEPMDDDWPDFHRLPNLIPPGESADDPDGDEDDQDERGGEAVAG